MQAFRFTLAACGVAGGAIIKGEDTFIDVFLADFAWLVFVAIVAGVNSVCFLMADLAR
jgi:hypothetical protein